jgi:hypothetical protein
LFPVADTRKLSIEERKTMNRLAKEIEKLEAQKEALHQNMADHVNDFEKLNALSSRFKKIRSTY